MVFGNFGKGTIQKSESNNNQHVVMADFTLHIADAAAFSTMFQKTCQMIFKKSNVLAFHSTLLQWHLASVAFGNLHDYISSRAPMGK